MSALVIVDTNVPLVANGESDSSPDCQERCVDALLRITGGHVRIAVDDAGLIVEEYGNKLSASTQGVGSQFLLWVYQHQWDPERAERVPITRDEGSEDECDFAEFPRSPALGSFDRSDRKFVAVAAAHPNKPPILEAADAKWIGWAPALADAGVTVEFLCEDELRAQFDGKHGRAQEKRRRG
jgi:hypothetical protein